MSTEYLYAVEYVERFNLRGVKIQHAQFAPVVPDGEGNIFTVYRALVLSRQLALVVASLEEAVNQGDIITYFYQQKKGYSEQ
jgi:hypothetical protein